jgi:uncharacterized protein YraI
MNQRTLRWGGALIGAGLATLVASPTLADVSGQVRTGGGPLNVRSGPGTGFSTYQNVDDGFTLTVVCQHVGSSVSGTLGTSSLWDQSSLGGWLSDAYVYTGSGNQVVPTCEYVADPPRANPRSVDDAISWEYQRLGSAADEGYCLRFQAQAFGWSYAGFATAHDQYQWLSDNGRINGGSPPRGALVWYSTRDGLGHVTVSVGAGRVIGTSVGGKVGVAGYNYLGSFQGWSGPYFARGG